MARPIALLALLAALAAALLPTTAGAKTSKTPKIVVEVAAIDIRGTYLSKGYSGGGDYDYRGILRYQGTVDEHGRLDLTPKPGRIMVGVVDPVEYHGVSTMLVKGETESWQCGMTMPDAWAPERLPMVVTFTRSVMHIGWTFVVPGTRCPEGSLRPTVPQLPVAATRSRVSVAKLKKLKRGKVGRINIRLAHRWSDDDAEHEMKFTGKVDLLRIR